jgi:hypothetical protein
VNLSADSDCLQKWNGSFFVKATLQSLGLRYQLGHSGKPCPCPQAGPKNFVIFDISGPHHLTIDYCQCGDEPLSYWVQFLREKWFPATLSRPQTVFTFDCLETFHELTLQGKTSLYDYFHTLLRLSDNANLSTPIVSSSCPLCFSQVLISIVPLSRDSSCIQDVEEFDVPQTSWSRSRPSRNWWDIPRRVDGRMSSLPPSRAKPP